ncbi:hypothetical protein NIES4071_39480 [Calothrix sp. NIES-4071]|nr:hypothetical protein NIES4071_39480 [Calothrix sp. NIES-4071]BAZ58266.1 hypothetical protein NIES4105_39420 [Calothrix sp. NIES-4105]
MASDGNTRWKFLPIDKKFQRDTFDCGYAVLNDYFKNTRGKIIIRG